MASDDPVDLDAIHVWLASLPGPALAVVLREVAFVLYDRNTPRWRVLLDLADAIEDEAVLAARTRAAESFTRLVSPRGPSSRGPRPRGT